MTKANRRVKTVELQLGEMVLDTIVIDRTEPPDPATVAALKESIAEIGLLQPLVVQPVGYIPHLVCGHSRFAALRELGRDAAYVIILPDRENVPDAALTARMAEIAENLHRREICEVERDGLIASWEELLEQRRDAQDPALISFRAEFKAQWSLMSTSRRRVIREIVKA